LPPRSYQTTYPGTICPEIAPGGGQSEDNSQKIGAGVVIPEISLAQAVHDGVDALVGVEDGPARWHARLFGETSFFHIP
jgi:hypothetical protein